MIFVMFVVVCIFDIYDENVVCYFGVCVFDVFVFGYLDIFCCLVMFCFGYNGEFGVEEVVEEGRFVGGLGVKDWDKVVVEISFGDMFGLEVVV